MPPAVATSQRGKTPSVQRDLQGTAGRPSGRRSGIRPSGYRDFLLLMDQASVEEVAGEQNSSHEDEQQSQIETGAVQFNRQVVGVVVTFHGLTISDG